MNEIYLMIGKFVYWAILVPMSLFIVVTVLVFIVDKIVKKLKILHLIAIFYENKDEFFKYKKAKNL